MLFGLILSCCMLKLLKNLKYVLFCLWFLAFRLEFILVIITECIAINNVYAIVNLGISLMHKCSAKLDAD